MTRAKAIPETITIHVPFRIVKRGGRKAIIPPSGVSTARPRSDNALIKAVARAFRWKRMLDSGAFISITEIAARESMSFTYMSRVLRLSLLAPDIVDAIMVGHQPQMMKLADLMNELPVEWELQHALWLIDARNLERS